MYSKFNQNYICRIESERYQNGQLYARLHLGVYPKNSALTFANALRRNLLSDIPALVITDVIFCDLKHEMDVIFGVQETIFDIIENLKKIVFANICNELEFLVSSSEEISIFLKFRGPGEIKACDLILPSSFFCVTPYQHIATISYDSEFVMELKLKLINPNKIKETYINHTNNFSNLEINDIKKSFKLNYSTNPVKKVNYLIKSLDNFKDLEYIDLELITDGSVTPKQVLRYSILNLSKFFCHYIF
uniref:RNA polymerase subunit alpha n=1 Tax=Prototheca fontanea TaxID=2836215 RepID=UPI0030011633